MNGKKKMEWVAESPIRILQKRIFKLERYVVTPEDEFRVEIRSPEGIQVWPVMDFNAFGLSFIIPHQNIDLRLLQSFLTFIVISQGQRKITTIPLAEITQVSFRGHELVVDIEFKTVHTVEKIPFDAELSGIGVQDDWQPYVVFEHPFLFEKHVEGKVVQVHNNGMRVSVQRQHSTLLPQTYLPKVNVQIPGVGDVDISAEVSDIQWSAVYPNHVFLDLKFLSTKRLVLEMFGELLVLHGQAVDKTVNLMKLMKDAGLYPKNIKKHMQYVYLSTKEEFQEVLQLRKLAYGSKGKVPVDVPVESMRDVYDDQSVIILCKHHHRVVGSIRVTYCKQPQDRFELEESITLPKEFQNRYDQAEISRMCIHPEYQRTDLVVGLMERAFMHSLRSNRKNIITSCDLKMIRFYKILGFAQTGIQFELKTLHGVPHRFIYLKTRKGMTGLGIHPAAYYQVLARFFRYNLDNKFTWMNPGILARFWIYLNGALGVIFLALFGRKK
jgi:predicted GNAT family N-acyltransferase